MKEEVQSLLNEKYFIYKGSSVCTKKVVKIEIKCPFVENSINRYDNSKGDVFEKYYGTSSILNDFVF